MPVLAIIQEGPDGGHANCSDVNEVPIKLTRSFNAHAINKFRLYLAQENWEGVYIDKNPSTAYGKFVSIVQLHVGRCFPLEIVKKAKSNSA